MSTRRERMDTHRAKMERKKRERANAGPTALQNWIAEHRAKGTLHFAFMNYSTHPRGKPRTRPPVYS